MVRLTNKMWKPVEDKLSDLLWFSYFQPIMDLIENDRLYNSRSAVLNAIRTGRITYVNGIFSGIFSIAISRDLAKYAKYERRSKTWKGSPPPDVLAASVIANEKAKSLNKQIKNLLPQLSNNLDDALKNMSYNLNPVAGEIDGQIKTSLDLIGVKPSLTELQIEGLKEDYALEQKLAILKWDPEQITSLRDMAERSALNGYRKKELIEMIMSEWGFAKVKAKFWARQSIAVFMVKLQETRYTSAGLLFYQWSTSHDERVRGKPGGLYPKALPTHFVMDRKYCKWSDPTVYSDDKKIWKSRQAIGAPSVHPGQDWNCRCVAVPVL